MKQLLTVFLLACTLGCPVAVLAAPDGKAAVSQAAVATINVNTATVKELQSLPGVGKVTAENIVTHRSANGPFKSKDELLKVKGVGDKTLEKIRQLITI